MKTKAQIEFGLIDVTAKKDSNLVINDKQEFVDLNDLKQDDIEEVKYGTCEKNQFVLDGSFELMPDTLDNMCWWSNQMSDKNGNFENPLTLEINFSEVHSSLGLTFTFSKAEDYCNHLNLKYYNLNKELISDKDFYPDSYYYRCDNVVNNYSKIIVTFYSTNNPYRYLKLYRILYGGEIIFEGENLKKANIIEEVDLLGAEVSINSLDFEVFSENDNFNIINPNGYFSLLQERQKFSVKEHLLKDNKAINMGTFYLEEWSSEKDKLMKLKAIDLIGIIDKTTFYGGMYKDIFFKDIIKEIMESAGLTDEDYEIDESIKNIVMNGYIPICSHREALQQVAFVVCAIVDCSRSEKIKIYSLKNKTKENIISKSTDVFQGTREIKQTDIVTGISMTLHNYESYRISEEINLDELEQLCSYTITEFGVHILTFDEPAFEIVPVIDISTTSVSENTIDYTILQKYNCNSATINFNIDIVGSQIALAMAKEKCLQEYKGIEWAYFGIENIKGYIYTVGVRNRNDTNIADWYNVDVENKTVESEFGLFEKTTVDPELKVTIYGYKYIHSETQYQINSNDIVSYKGNNVLKIDSSYLLNTSNMQSVAKNILDYYNKTYEDKFQKVLNEESVVDLIKIDTNFQQLLKGNIKSLDIDLTGGFIAEVKVIDKVYKENEVNQ